MNAIDLDILEKPKVGTYNGHDVRGVAPPEKLGVHGTQVALNHDVGNGDEICVSVCPISVFEMIDTAREVNCPTQATKITKS